MLYNIELFYNYFLHPMIYLILSVLSAVLYILFIKCYKKSKFTFKRLKTFLLYDIGIYVINFLICTFLFHKDILKTLLIAVIALFVIFPLSNSKDNDDDDFWVWFFLH